MLHTSKEVPEAVQADSAEPGRYTETPQYDPEKLLPRPARWPIGRYLLASDVAIFFLASILTDAGLVTQSLLLVSVVMVYSTYGLYRSRLNLSILDDLPYICGACAIAFLLAVALEQVLPQSVSIVGYGTQMALFCTMAVLLRAVEYYIVRAARRRGAIRKTAIVVGAGNVGVWLTDTLLEHREYGVDVVGFLDERPRIEQIRRLPAPLLGGYGELAEVIEDFDARVVIVAFGSMPESALVEVLRTCDRLMCDMLMVPRLYEIHATTREMDQVWGLPLVRMRRAPFRSVAWKLKRLFDTAVSALALLLLSPIMLAGAIAVRIEGGPGILFRQERVGLDGRHFSLLKFRSMKPATVDESQTNWNIAQDARVGPVGRFIRTTSIDELPQLWNIFRGDMSLVGPRPERPHFVDEFGRSIQHYSSRHRVPCGLTGWAQVHGLRGDTSIEQRAKFDNYYIENWSLWSDCKILLRTIWQVLGRKGC